MLSKTVPIFVIKNNDSLQLWLPLISASFSTDLVLRREEDAELDSLGKRRNFKPKNFTENLVFPITSNSLLNVFLLRIYTQPSVPDSRSTAIKPLKYIVSSWVKKKTPPCPSFCAVQFPFICLGFLCFMFDRWALDESRWWRCFPSTPTYWLCPVLLASLKKLTIIVLIEIFHFSISSCIIITKRYSFTSFPMSLLSPIYSIYHSMKIKFSALFSPWLHSLADLLCWAPFLCCQHFRTTEARSEKLFSQNSFFSSWFTVGVWEQLFEKTTIGSGIYIIHLSFFARLPR